MPTPTRPFLRALPALASLAVLGLAAAPAAHAQSLLLSGTDGVTVNGLGTFGIISSVPVTNGTTSYDDSTSSSYAVETNDASTFTLENGGTLSATTFGSDYGLLDQSSGTATVSGGTIEAGDAGVGVLADSLGAVNISGGTISTGDNGTGLKIYSGGAITFSGGTITAGDSGKGVNDLGSGSLTISGGTITAGDNGFGLFADGNGAVSITGGTLSAEAGSDGLEARGNGAVSITGGVFSGGLGGYGLYADGGVIDLYGSFIDPSGTALTLGQTESLSYGVGSFSGTLENNTVGQTFTYNNNFSTIILHDVGPAATPEPSGFVGLGIGLLGLAALGMKARRQSASSR